MKTVSERIVEIAQACLGQHEKTGNAGFINPAFEKRMRAVGFEPGMAWCALFAELCWTEAFAELKPALLPEIAARFTPGAVPTLNSFRLSKVFRIGTIPKPGAVAVWRHGLSGWQGHAGIVVSSAKDVFVTIEGNTNGDGGREGIEVAGKTRQLDWRKLPNRLNLVGFIYCEPA